MDLYSGCCNICYKSVDESLKDISEENAKNLKDSLITFVGYADIVSDNIINLCPMCCEELTRSIKFREMCYTNLMQLPQIVCEMKSKLECFCNICCKADNRCLKDTSEENMKNLKHTLITFVGHADIIKDSIIHLCQSCCVELARFNKFREICFTHFIQLRQSVIDMKSKLELEDDASNIENKLQIFVHQEVLRRYTLEKNNCPVLIPTEYDIIESSAVLSKNHPVFNREIIHLQSERNECPLAGDCSDLPVINSATKCDVSQVAFKNEGIALVKCETESDEDVEYTNEEIHVKMEVVLSDPEDFECKSGGHDNEGMINSGVEYMKEALYVKQESSSEDLKLDTIEKNNCPVLIPTEYDIIENSAVLSKNHSVFDRQIINLQSERNECPLAGDSSDLPVINSATECDVSQVAFKNEGFAFVKWETESDDVEYRKEEFHVKKEIVLSDPEDFECKSEGHVSEGMINSGIEYMEEALYVKQENSSSEVLKSETTEDDFGDGQNVPIDFVNVSLIVKTEECEVDSIAIEENALDDMNLPRIGCSSTLTAAIDVQPNRLHVRGIHNKRSSKALQSGAHNRVHQDVEAHTCTVCNKSFRTMWSLTEHARIHSGARPFKCTVCNKTFTQSGSLTTHERIHSGARLYKCTVCNKTFTKSGHLTSHERIHSGARPFKCTICNKTFTESGYLTRHERIHSGARPFKCTVCNKTFTQSGDLSKHERIHSGARPYKCTVCNKTFTESGSLTRHERLHSGARPFKCTVCNKTFTQSGHLTKHQRLHSGARPFKCTICNKTFTESGSLTKHERIHSGARPFKCTVCNKTFTESGYLTKHERIHSGARPYKCTVCNKTFTQSGHLTKHQRLHSGARPFKCTVCNKTFTESGSLTTHERIHSGARPFKCTVCNKTFTQSGHLTRHERLHSGARPFKCTVCNKTFTESGHLTRHELIHSGARPHKRDNATTNKD